MKKIQSVPIWQNGSVVEATYFSAISQSDNLQNAASFQYTLFSGVDKPEAAILTSGLAIGGEDYANWDGSNDYPYTWLAEKLSLVIIGDYVPVIEEPIEEEQSEEPIEEEQSEEPIEEQSEGPIEEEEKNQ